MTRRIRHKVQSAAWEGVGAGKVYDMLAAHPDIRAQCVASTPMPARGYTLLHVDAAGGADPASVRAFIDQAIGSGRCAAPPAERMTPRERLAQCKSDKERIDVLVDLLFD